MHTLQRGVLDLLKSCLLQETIPLPEDFDWMTACRLGQAHGILPMLYYGAAQAGVTLPDEVRGGLERTAMRSVLVDQNQLYEIGRICDTFLAHGIDFMPLKGTLLKPMYPKTEMRPMGDADILIRVEQYPAIKPLMEELGFREVLESDHELIWHKNTLHVELHKRLIPSYNKDYYAYFGDGWRLAQKTDTTAYRMGDEDHFIYLFTHYAKHYRDAGIGIRHAVDLYVFLQKHPDLDWTYIDGELEKLQLIAFCRNTLDTLHVWFDGAADTAMSDFITNRIFGSGSFGTQANSVMADALKTSKTVEKEQVQKEKTLRLLFPSLKAMSTPYPWVGKCPLLLPFAWVYRWVVVLLFKRETLRQQRERLDTLTVDNINAYQNELNYVGLDFNFE